MRAAGWGRIVHVSTGLVEGGSPGSADYTTPKAALHGLTPTMSRELARPASSPTSSWPGSCRNGNSRRRYSSR